LYDLNEGQIFWNNTEVLGPKSNLIPGMDFMKYLAQDFDLMPYITVAENIGKFLSNMYPDQKSERIRTLLELVEMTEFSNIKVQFLSGGQMQRVAIARVLALEPEVVLLDEPFSHIDNFRKNSLRRKVFQYLKEKEITCIIASHDSKDVLAYSDETLVIRNGKVIANADTKFIYENPSNHYVATLYDDVSVLPDRILNIDSKAETSIFVYPYQLKVVADSNLKVAVSTSYFKGNGYLVEAFFQNHTVFFESEKTFEKGELVCLKYLK
jgi:ABC-type sulfate/molybdate transport systems ATPase subunit